MRRMTIYDFVHGQTIEEVERRIIEKVGDPPSVAETMLDEWAAALRRHGFVIINTGTALLVQGHTAREAS